MKPQTAATILIVEDEASTRLLLDQWLRTQQFSTVLAANGDEALRQIARQAPDLLLLDVMMPGMDGYQLAKILKTNPATAHIPIIVLTALSDRKARLACLAAGAEDFLLKPVDLEELALRARNLLRLKQLGDFFQNQNRSLEEKVQASTAELRQLADLQASEAAQLLASNQELEAFSYSVSHDLRTPLSTIDGFSALLAKEFGAASADLSGPASERATHYVSRIRAGVTHMVGLIDAMLLMAQTTHDPLPRKSVNLSAMAAEVIAGHREREPGRAVLVQIQPDLITYGDAFLLRQVLENLIGNAWKFSAQAPETQISFGRDMDEDGRQVYTLQDNGVGFDMAEYDALFCAFSRLQGTQEFAGTGLGLANVRRIIARHGGSVWADSVLGQGARFSFTLGKKPPLKQESPGTNRTPPRWRLTGQREKRSRLVSGGRTPGAV